MTLISANNKTLAIWTLIVLVLSLGFLFTQFHNWATKNKIIKNAAFTTGKFTGIVRPFEKGKNGPWYECEYEVKGNTYKAYKPVAIVKQLGNLILSHTFPIIYDSTNPSHGLVLISQSDFTDLNLKFPDSLHHILTN